MTAALCKSLGFQWGRSALRSFSYSCCRLEKEEVEIVFAAKKPEAHEFRVKTSTGPHLLEVVRANKLEFPWLGPFGTCEGTLACSTCHVMLDKDAYEDLEDEMTDEEFSMIQLAYKPTPTSRLCCQEKHLKTTNIFLHLEQSGF